MSPRRCRCARALAIALAGVWVPPLLAAAGPVPLVKSLVFTSTTHSALVSSAGSLPVADIETIYSVDEIGPERVSYSFNVSGEKDPAAETLIRNTKKGFQRDVNRSDQQSALRMSILFDSTDPQILPGQTFAGTSAAVIQALAKSGEVAFVLGINEADGAMGLIAGAASALPKPSVNGAPLDLGAMMAAMAGARHYYRGTLKKLGTEPFSVLLNGQRTSVPAVHVKGDMTFTDKKLTPELWWLDDPANPITLKWAAENAYEVVTRIDVPPPPHPSADAAGGGLPAAGGAGALSSLAGKDCRAELSGVYFTTASAAVLQASLPALERFAELLRQHPDWQVTIEGHTDNIGSAPYNLELSARRAAAVRGILINQFKVPAERLKAQGFGLTRPVETNATDQGRAHNRRVEVSRSCH